MKKALLQGHLKNGLYEFSPQSVSPLTTFLTSSSIHTSKPSHHMAEIWHSHLSHPVDVVLKRILTTCSIPYSCHHQNVCCACQYAKSHGLPFVLFESKVSHPLVLIHMDLRGLTPILSVTPIGFK